MKFTYTTFNNNNDHKFIYTLEFVGNQVTVEYHAVKCDLLVTNTLNIKSLDYYLFLNGLSVDDFSGLSDYLTK
jgi:hypothetical protein